MACFLVLNPIRFGLSNRLRSSHLICSCHLLRMEVPHHDVQPQQASATLKSQHVTSRLALIISVKKRLCSCQALVTLVKDGRQLHFLG